MPLIAVALCMGVVAQLVNLGAAGGRKKKMWALSGLLKIA
jgi:hypothetical protein